MYSYYDESEDLKFFVEHNKELFEKYGPCFLAIKNGKVLGHADYIQALIDLMKKDYPDKDYLIQECELVDENFREAVYENGPMIVSIENWRQ